MNDNDPPAAGGSDEEGRPLEPKNISRERRMRGMVAELERLAADARTHLEIMQAAVQESIGWSDPRDVLWARDALDDAIISAVEAERDLREARAIVGELFR